MAMAEGLFKVTHVGPEGPLSPHSVHEKSDKAPEYPPSPVHSPYNYGPNSVDRSGAGLPGSRRLDQREDNRTEPITLAQELAEGEVVVLPRRSAGSFDPTGCRGCDVKRREMVVRWGKEERPGWKLVIVTLTVDRSAFLSPAMAYQAVNERSRKALSAVGVEWVCALELQTRTGDGWPHYHALVWVPAESKVSELKSRVLSRWTTFDIDYETGEIRGRLTIGFVDVQDVRSSGGAAVYASKYITKQWQAIPPWMLDDTRRFRKLRYSNAFYEWAQTAGLHIRHVGSRRHPTHHQRPARTLLERRADSGSACVLFRRNGGKLERIGEALIPFDHADYLLARKGHDITPVVRGKRIKGWRISRVAAGALLSAGTTQEAEQNREAWLELRRSRDRAAWHDMQQSLEALEAERESVTVWAQPRGVPGRAEHGVDACMKPPLIQPVADAGPQMYNQSEPGTTRSSP